VTLISVGLNVFALVAMFIAAVGTTNTLVQSVLERTREIGILKAVGAKDGDVSAVFLAEGAAVGVLGGILGVIAARLIAGPADTLVNDLVRKVSQQKMITQSVFDFPWWLCGGAVLFAVLVTTLAAWYPARRAARIEPVDALRHE
jgi:putative ABC transport system permease protein